MIEIHKKMNIFTVDFYYAYSQNIKFSFSKIRVAYNNLYRKIVHVPPRCSASKMFVDNNIPYFEACFFTSRLTVSINSIIRAIENCWLI